MGREFHPRGGLFTKAPASLQAALCMPSPVNRQLRGRVELVIGRLGAGKTTWGALRATRLARATDRQLVTNGVGWAEPWQCVQSFRELDRLRESVFLWDELHLMLPSSKGLLSKDDEKFLIRFLSLLRKRGNCVVGTTQAWTRCATHFRQLVTTVWQAQPHTPGRLHVAVPYDRPDDGGLQQLSAQWFGPAAARIPTNAEVWYGPPIEDDDDDEIAGEAAPADSTLSSLVGPPFGFPSA